MEAVTTFLADAWRPAVEILILAVGINYAFTFLRGTRGAPVVTGFLVLLLALTFTTRLLDLQVLNALLSEFFAFLAIAIVVLFHPEIRKMFAEVGNLPLFSNTEEQRENVEIIVQTAERLARDRIGALIAIEKGVQLNYVVEAGVQVDCEATPEMLETIFFPNTALHDGGVVLRGDRILQAACIFPLSQRPDLSRSMGTRHRAAIGLSEETDAIVVVVSEENGKVSYAHRGQLTRNVSVSELRGFLTRELVRRTKRGMLRWLRTRIRLSRRPAA